MCQLGPISVVQWQSPGDHSRKGAISIFQVYTVVVAIVAVIVRVLFISFVDLLVVSVLAVIVLLIPIVFPKTRPRCRRRCGLRRWPASLVSSAVLAQLPGLPRPETMRCGLYLGLRKLCLAEGFWDLVFAFIQQGPLNSRACTKRLSNSEHTPRGRGGCTLPEGLQEHWRWLRPTKGPVDVQLWGNKLETPAKAYNFGLSDCFPVCFLFKSPSKPPEAWTLAMGPWMRAALYRRT